MFRDLVHAAAKLLACFAASNHDIIPVKNSIEVKRKSTSKHLHSSKTANRKVMQFPQKHDIDILGFFTPTFSKYRARLADNCHAAIAWCRFWRIHPVCLLSLCHCWYTDSKQLSYHPLKRAGGSLNARRLKVGISDESLYMTCSEKQPKLRRYTL